MAVDRGPSALAVPRLTGGGGLEEACLVPVGRAGRCRGGLEDGLDPVFGPTGRSRGYWRGLFGTFSGSRSDLSPKVQTAFGTVLRAFNNKGWARLAGDHGRHRSTQHFSSFPFSTASSDIIQVPFITDGSGGNAKEYPEKISQGWLRGTGKKFPAGN